MAFTPQNRSSFREGEMLAFVFVLFAIAVRVDPSHIMAFTPVGAALLYFGARGPRKLVWVPLTLFAATDIYLTLFYYHYSFSADHYVTWAWYAAILLLGTLLRRNIGVLQVFGASLATAFSFFIVSNFAVWAVWPDYPKNLAGLMECYTLGLPFFRREVVSDVLFSAVFFGLPALAGVLAARKCPFCDLVSDQRRLYNQKSMAILWQDEKLDPESIVIMFERERKAWLEMAESIEKLKPSLVSGGVALQAANLVHDCRARAEALKRLVSRLCEQYNLPDTHSRVKL
jgi:hypothetical protein